MPSGLLSSHAQLYDRPLCIRFIVKGMSFVYKCWREQSEGGGVRCAKLATTTALQPKEQMATNGDLSASAKKKSASIQVEGAW